MLNELHDPGKHLARSVDRSSSTYVEHAEKNVKLLLRKGRIWINSVGEDAISEYNLPIRDGHEREMDEMDISVELDTSDECDDDGSSRISQLIGVLRWAVELGMIHIHPEVTLLSPQLALPQV